MLVIIINGKEGIGFAQPEMRESNDSHIQWLIHPQGL